MVDAWSYPIGEARIERGTVLRDRATDVRLRVVEINDAAVRFDGNGNPVPFEAVRGDIEGGSLVVEE